MQGLSFDQAFTIDVTASRTLGNVKATVSGTTLKFDPNTMNMGHDLEIISSLTGITVVGHNGTTINGLTRQTFANVKSLTAFQSAATGSDRIRVTVLLKT